MRTNTSGSRVINIGAILAFVALGGIALETRTASGQQFQPGQLIGGGTRQMAVDPTQIGGFLPHPELLQAGGQGRADLLYINPSANMSSYNQLMIGPVTIWAAPGSQLNNVPADQRLALTNAAYSDIYYALAQRCQIVQAASPGTIYLQFALVDTTVPNATLNTVRHMLPMSARPTASPRLPSTTALATSRGPRPGRCMPPTRPTG